MTFLVKLLVKLLLDALLLILLVIVFGRGKRGRYSKLLLTSLGLAAAWGVHDLLPRWLFGYVFAVPLIVFTGVVLMVAGRLRLKHAAIASGLFFLLHVVIACVL